MNVTFYIDPGTGLPHILSHGVDETEVEDVLESPSEDRPGREGSRVALGRTSGGRYVRVIYVPDRAPDQIFVITAYELSPNPPKDTDGRREESGRGMRELQGK